MRDYAMETEKRVAFIREVLENAHASGVIFGNSGGKDSALVGILCRRATENVLGVIMPCESKRNFTIDMDDGNELAEKFGIKTVTVDLTASKAAVMAAASGAADISDAAKANVAPRLRMTTLYTIGQSLNYLVAGTGNRSEGYMGYFTKWGDGAFDFNPISDLTVREIYEFLEYLEAPRSIIEKAPSAGLFEGQTDEGEMGVTYAEIDSLLLEGYCSPEAKEIIDRYHLRSEHKRRPALTYEKDGKKD